MGEPLSVLPVSKEQAQRENNTVSNLLAYEEWWREAGRKHPEWWEGLREEWDLSLRADIEDEVQKECEENALTSAREEVESEHQSALEELNERVSDLKQELADTGSDLQEAQARIERLKAALEAALDGKGGA